MGHQKGNGSTNDVPPVDQLQLLYPSKCRGSLVLVATKPCKVKHLNHINMGDLRSSLSNLRSSADNFSGNHCYYRNQHFKTTQPCAKPSESSKQPMSLNHFNYTFTLCTCNGGFQPKYCMHFFINSFWDSNLHSF